MLAIIIINRPSVPQFALAPPSVLQYLVCQVRWFYHPAEVEGSAEGGGRVEDLVTTHNALFSSSHADENDVQVLSRYFLIRIDSYPNHIYIADHLTQVLAAGVRGVPCPRGRGERHGGCVLPRRRVRPRPRHHPLQPRGHPIDI